LIIKVVLSLVFIAIETLEVGDVSRYLITLSALGADCEIVDFDR
jgi:hypothetical protein